MRNWSCGGPNGVGTTCGSRRTAPRTTTTGAGRTDESGKEGQLPGHSSYVLRGGKPYLTYSTTARETEAILPVAHIMDRTAYGRQQHWEDSPQGWPQYPTYG